MTFGSTNFAASDFSLTSTIPSLTGIFVLNSSSLLLQLTISPAILTGILDIGGAPIGASPLPVDGGTLRTLANTTFPNDVTVASGGVIVDSNGFDSNFTGVFSGPGGFTKINAGAVTLAGANTYTGDTTVDGGSLLITGSIQSPNTYVNPLGLLGGTGTIGGNVFNHGVVSPGLSPGTLTIIGNYTQFSDGRLRIEIASANTFDRLVIGGTATLAGKVEVLGVGGFVPKKGDSFRFLTAAGGVSGTFDSVDHNFGASGTILKLGLVYEPNAVVLEFVQGSFAEFANFFGLTRNQQSVAKALDELAFHGRAEKLISFLNSELLENLPKDFDRIAPEEHAALYEISFSLANVQHTNLQRRMDDIRSGVSGFTSQRFAMAGIGRGNSSSFGLAGPTGSEGRVSKNVETSIEPVSDNRWGVFVTGLGEFVNVDGTQNARGYDLSTGGITLGVDYRVRPGFAIGVNGGYARTYADLVDDGRVTVDGGKIGLYATVFCPDKIGMYVDAAVGAGLNSYDTQRRGLRGRVRGDTDSTELNALVGAGYDLKRSALTIGPTATFQYTYLDIDGFRERGSLAPLDVQGRSTESVRSTLGFKASYDLKVGRVLVKPEIRAAWQHEYGDREYAIEARIANGAGNTFTVDGPLIGRDSLLLGAGVAVQFSERVSTYLYYDGELARTGYDAHNVSGGIRIDF